MDIIGARGGIFEPEDFIKHANEVFRSRNLQAQVVDSRFVLDEVHVTLAFEQAARRVASKNPISRSLAMEFLLYLAGTHQISVAIDRLGMKTDSEHLLIVILEGDAPPDPAALLEELGLTAEEPVFALDLCLVLKVFDIPSAVADGSDPEQARKAVYEALSLVNLEK